MVTESYANVAFPYTLLISGVELYTISTCIVGIIVINFHKVYYIITDYSYEL